MQSWKIRSAARYNAYHDGKAGTPLGNNLVPLVRQIGNANGRGALRCWGHLAKPVMLGEDMRMLARLEPRALCELKHETEVKAVQDARGLESEPNWMNGIDVRR